jgi:hypothetical protein
MHFYSLFLSVHMSLCVHHIVDFDLTRISQLWAHCFYFYVQLFVFALFALFAILTLFL